tara:strand:- start:9919 stop:10947 length:1029 start_codon:yes stop_codon:yes gene_type:complete
LNTIIETKESTQLAGTFFKKAHKLVFSQLSLTPVEHDIFALFLSRLKKQDWDDFLTRKTLDSPCYTFSNRVLSEWFGVDKANLFNVLKKPASKLAHQVIGVIDDDEKRFKFLPLFKHVEYVQGSLTLVPNDMLINEYLCVSQGHSQIPHVTFRNLKRDYSKRLYSMLCRFKDQSKSELHYLTIDDLYANFGLLDQSGKLVKKTYGEFAYLMNRIIKPAIKEIAEKEPDIEFLVDQSSGHYGFCYRKQGRKVIALKFLYHWKLSTAYQEKQVYTKLVQEPSAYDRALQTLELISKTPKDKLSSIQLTKKELAHLTIHIPSFMKEGVTMDMEFFSKLSTIQNSM